LARNPPFWRKASLAAILLVALALRLAPWGQNRFLEDEALYAYWGLQIATGADPMLDDEPVDKPPLYAYTLALSFRLFGHDETAARLPSLLSSVASVALVYALARALSLTPTAARSPLSPWGRGAGACPERSRRGEGTALLAALLLALSPFDVLFASTAFTDPLMVAWVLAALLAAARGRLGAAGLLAGLAAATKQQGLFFLPLVIAVGMLSSQAPRVAKNLGVNAQAERAKPLRGWLQARRAWLSQRGALAPQHSAGRRFLLDLAPPYSTWLRFLLAFALVAAAVFGWDAARVQRPGFWEQGILSYGGLGPAQPEALAERAVEWLRLAGYFWASPGFYLLWAVTWVAVLLGIRQSGNWGIGKVDLGISIFVVAYLVVHWLLGFQVWDRYLLGLVPLAALLAGRVLAALGQTLRQIRWRQVYAVALPLALVTLLIGPVSRAAHSELPVGGDHGAYDGIDQLAAYIRANAPAGAVLYHHWLGYHYRFYLYGVPLRLHWYPDPADLAHDAMVYRHEPRYIAFPSFRDGALAQAALVAAGITLTPIFEATRRDGTVSFRLYRLEGP
jgi:hypothetical protein